MASILYTFYTVKQGYGISPTLIFSSSTQWVKPTYVFFGPSQSSSESADSSAVCFIQANDQTALALVIGSDNSKMSDLSKNKWINILKNYFLIVI